MDAKLAKKRYGFAGWIEPKDHIEVVEHGLALLGERGRGRLGQVGSEGPGFGENPGIADGTPGDQDGVDIIMGQFVGYILSSKDVTTAGDEGMRETLFDLSDNVPIGPVAISALNGAAVNYQPVYPNGKSLFTNVPEIFLRLRRSVIADT